MPEPMELRPKQNLPPQPPDLLPPSTKEQRESNWRAMSDYVNTLTDGLGLGIDEGIKEPVVGLNLLGVNTRQSCEGHVDTGHGIAAPWIDIKAKPTTEAAGLREASMKLLDDAEKMATEKGYDDVEVAALYKEHHRLNKESRKQELVEAKKAMDLLSEFYAERQVPYDRRLVLDVKGYGGATIHPQGSNFQELAEPDVRRQKLVEYQQEMKDFSVFLKAKYIGE